MKRFFWICLIILTASAKTSYSQSVMPVHRSYRIAVFAPLYLDSVFNKGLYRYGNSLPKFNMPAVEFMQGAHIAFDTLPVNETVSVFMYDSKSNMRPISWLIKYRQLDSMNLIIGAVKDPALHELANFALQKNIPFVSATYPNDGGIIANPNLIIVNPTLRANCEGIFSYLLQKHGTDKIYLVKRKGDDRIENYFREINYADGKRLLDIHPIMIDSSISSYSLMNRIDTNATSVIIGASLDEDFATMLADACYPIQKKHSLVLIGMPNWDGFRSLYRKDVYKDFPIRYTTPHFDADSSIYDSMLIKKYFKLYRARPSDMAYKGFEVAWYFTKLLLAHPDNLMENLNDSAYAVFHNFNFRPVYVEKQNKIPDYYENKHLFIMQILNGDAVREW